MNIFINISHPAHVHFFKNVIKTLSERGHKILIGSRNKEFTVYLLKSYNLDHSILTSKGNGFIGLVKELVKQQIRICEILKQQRIDIMLQIGGIFNAPIGRYYGIPTMAFSDTENDKWGNKVSFGLSKHVFSPTCFDRAIGGVWENQIFYPGYHELAYLSPCRGYKRIEPGNEILVRFVGWGAGHDIGERKLSNEQKIQIVNILKEWGSVHVSSEAPLPKAIDAFAYEVDPADIHDFMKKCKLVVGESATMTSEAACLGIPAVFISNTGRGYTTEQDKKYGLIKHYRLDQWEEIVGTLKLWAKEDLHKEWEKRRWNMLRDKIDVSAWLVDLIEGYPRNIKEAMNGSFERYYLNCAG